MTIAPVGTWHHVVRGADVVLLEQSLAKPALVGHVAHEVGLGLGLLGFVGGF